MTDVAIVACLAALALIALLPRVFFRPGRLNARWWSTAMPFVAAGVALVGALAGLLDPLATGETRQVLAWAAIACAAGGAALIRWTLHAHARPVSLWHQDDDRPDELVTRGPYAHVRHPFYASFLLVLGGCALAFPHALTLAALATAALLLNRTAAREERRLTEAFGEHYAAYVRRTGRFVPRGIAGGGSSSDALRRPLLVLTLLLATSSPTGAQQRLDRFAATRPSSHAASASSFDVPSPSHERASSRGPAIAGGMLLGALTGAIAAAPELRYELMNCRECMLLGLHVPVFVAGGILVGGIAGGAIAGGSYDERPHFDRAGRPNRRSRAQDAGVGATLGLVAGTLATIAVVAIRADAWDDDYGPAATQASSEPLFLGLVAPISVFAGAATGSLIDARGGDIPFGLELVP